MLPKQRNLFVYKCDYCLPGIYLVVFMQPLVSKMLQEFIYTQIRYISQHFWPLTKAKF